MIGNFLITDIYKIEKCDVSNCPFSTQEELKRYLDKRVYKMKSKWYGFDVGSKKHLFKAEPAYLKAEEESVLNFLNLKNRKPYGNKLVEMDNLLKIQLPRITNTIANNSIDHLYNPELGIFWTFADLESEFMGKFGNALHKICNEVEQDGSSVAAKFLIRNKRKLQVAIENGIEQYINNINDLNERNTWKIATAESDECLVLSTMIKDSAKNKNYIFNVLHNDNSPTQLLWEVERKINKINSIPGLESKAWTLAQELLLTHKNYVKASASSILDMINAG